MMKFVYSVHVSRSWIDEEIMMYVEVGFCCLQTSSASELLLKLLLLRSLVDGVIIPKYLPFSSVSVIWTSCFSFTEHILIGLFLLLPKCLRSIIRWGLAPISVINYTVSMGYIVSMLAINQNFLGSSPYQGKICLSGLRYEHPFHFPNWHFLWCFSSSDYRWS